MRRLAEQLVRWLIVQSHSVGAPVGRGVSASMIRVVTALDGCAVGSSVKRLVTASVRHAVDVSVGHSVGASYGRADVPSLVVQLLRRLVVQLAR